MGDTITKYRNKFKHYYHPYLEEFLRNMDNLACHRLRIAHVAHTTDRLSFREEVPDQMVADAIQFELDFPNELEFYASLGCFHPSELVAEYWNTAAGFDRILDALYLLYKDL